MRERVGVRVLFLLLALLGFGRAGADPVLVVITGVGGEPQFDQRFHAWAATLMDAAEGRFGLSKDAIVYLASDVERDPERARGRSTKKNVEATLASLASNVLASGSPATAPLFVVVIGHGSFSDGISKVNLPGPDMTAEDFSTALAAFGERPLVFANLTSASGGFLGVLSAPGRTVITATKSGMERNASVFGQFFVAAFVGDDADVDNDGELTVLEAFNYARREVARDYEGERKILTEHAQLDDNGDGKGGAEPGVDAEDGRLAATMKLKGASVVDAEASDDPKLEGLRREKARLEEAIGELRRRKADLGQEEYENQLEELLIQLALANRSLRDG